MADGYAALGFMKEMSVQVSTDKFINDVVTYAHAAMASDFDNQVANAARTNPDRLHHVYEPGHVGMQEFQLWEHRLYGRGKNRQASFEWKESVLPILNPEERHSDPNDPMSKVPEDVIENLSDRKYIFYMRAPIMEYRMRVNIAPKNAKYLFIPTFKKNWHKGKSASDSYTGNNFRFAKQNTPDWDYRNPQEPSGGEGTVGQVTAQWVAFWAGGGADATWSDKVKRVVETDLGSAENAMPKRTRRRSSNITIAAFADNDAAYEAGSNLARAFIRGKAKSYAQAAKYIQKKGLFGGMEEY
jgi:hypothetical protein